MHSDTTPVSLPRLALYVLVVAGVVVILTSGWYAIQGARGATPLGASIEQERPPTQEVPTLPLADSLRGRSKVLRFAALTRAEALALPGFLGAFGELAIRTPAAYRVRGVDSTGFALIVMRPFGEKRGEMLGGYRLGRWPAERWMMARNYFNPDGFVEVTPENATLPLSAHFRVGDFVTHDQEATWPKYVVLEERLIDKLELVLQDLAGRGHNVNQVTVLSGFRAPYYNQRGIGEGMARGSRHQYGDAADVIIDADGNGRMDDLNGDGRIDLSDIVPVSAAVARVERAWPMLTGGLGTYAATGPSGPFAHVDVRGTSARWESGWWKKRLSTTNP